MTWDPDWTLQQAQFNSLPFINALGGAPMVNVGDNVASLVYSRHQRNARLRIMFQASFPAGGQDVDVDYTIIGIWENAFFVPVAVNVPVTLHLPHDSNPHWVEVISTPINLPIDDGFAVTILTRDSDPAPHFDLNAMWWDWQ